MSTQRITPVEPPYGEQLQRAFDAIMPPGVPPLAIFRTVGRNPRVLSRMVAGGLLDKGAIAIAQRELVILRSCARCGAEYEWNVHVMGFAAKAGFSDAQIADTKELCCDRAIWSEEQLTLIDMVDELHNSKTLSDARWEALKRFFSDEQLIELIMLTGLYHAVSFLVNSLHITHEPSAF